MAGLAGGLLGIRSWLGASGLTLLGAIVSSLLSDHSSEIFSVTVLVAGALIAIEPLPRPQTTEGERNAPD